MPGAKKNFIGLEGFIWWIGVVEDRQDPEQLGRVRVRCFGWHTDQKDKIPTDSLPWAQPIIPVNNSNFSTPKEGDMVFGFFIDGDNAQQPAIMGIVPGKPLKKPNYQFGFTDPRSNLSSAPKKPDDPAEKYPKSKYLREPNTNRLSRGKAEATVIATRKRNLKKNVKSAGKVTWNEPTPTFNPVYPYNNAYESESGHALEFDDTPNNERVHLAHRTGAFIEFDKDGSRIEKVQKDNYTIVMGDDFIYVKGKAAITVDGNFNLKTSTINIEAKEINMAADGAVRIKGKTVNIESTSSMDLKAGSSGKFTSGARMDVKGSTIGIGGSSVDIPGPLINLQGGSVGSASGAGITGGGATPSSSEAAAALEQTNALSATANSVAALPDELQEVQLTAQRVAGDTTGTLFGKSIGNSLTTDSLVKTIENESTSILKDFSNKLPIGELSSKVGAFENTVNDNAGNILSLRSDIKNNLLSKVDQVSQQASDKNISFNLDTRLSTEIDTLKSKSPAQTENLMGKHVYPKTETITTEQTNALLAIAEANRAKNAANTGG